MKDLFIFRGMPGSGKTTAAESLAGGKYPVLSNDDYFMVDGKYLWAKEKMPQARAYCRQRAEEAMKNGLDKVFIANVHADPKEMLPYEELARKYGYKVFYLIVENRQGTTDVHNVPDQHKQGMRDKFEISL